MPCEQPRVIKSNCSLLRLMRVANLELDRLMRRQFEPDCNISDFVNDALSTASKCLDVQRVSVWLYSKDQEKITCFSLYETETAEFSDYRTNPCLHKASFPNYFKALRDTRVIDAHDAVNDPRTSEFTDAYFRPLGIASLLDAQVPSSEGIKGVVCCETIGQRRTWSPDEISFVAAISSMIGQAFERQEREAMVAQLHHALEAAEKANEARATFLAQMSHELRTPLNGVIGIAQTLALSDLTETQKEKVDVILESGETLLTVVNDILDLTRIDSDKMEISPVDGELDSLVERRIGQFQSAIIEKGLKLNVEMPTDAPKRLKFDQVRVGQCLSNLLSNAVKFTHQGEITVKVDVSALGDDYLVSIAVSDTGIGITPEERRKLFTKFGQADSSITRQYSGIGLGLCISRQLARLMDGDVTFRSESGVGSCFTLTFKAEAASQDMAADSTAQNQHEAGALAGLRFLVIDDNHINRRVVRTILNAQDAHIVDASSGHEALNILETQRDFDLIILDIHMPEMDGFEVLRRIKARESAIKHLPVMALTADAMRGDRERMLMAGMDGYVAKPIVLDDFFGEITRVLNAQQQLILAEIA